MSRTKVRIGLIVVCTFVLGRHCWSREPVLVGSFESETNISAIDYDELNDRLLVAPTECHSPGCSENIDVFDADGKVTGSLNLRATVGDFEVLPVPIQFGESVFPAGTILAIGGNSDSVIAFDGAEFSIIGSLAIRLGFDSFLLGGTYDAANERYLLTDRWNGDVATIDLTKTSFHPFPFHGPTFPGRWNDIEVHDNTGSVWFVGTELGDSSSEFIIETTSDFEVLQSFPAEQLGLANIEGIAFDHIRNETWIGTHEGTLYRFKDFSSVPEPGLPISCHLTVVVVCGLLRLRRGLCCRLQPIC